MSQATTAKKGLQLGKLSSVAQLVVNKPVPKADADIELSRIFSKKQVRRIFKNLEELAESIKVHGLIYPLLVHEEEDGTYRIIAGERRYRAAKIAGLDKAPVIIKRGLSEREIRALQVAENSEREDLTPFEEAMGVVEDVEEYGTKEAMAIWNRSEAWISKRMGIKRYSEPVRALLEEDVCGDLEVLQSLNQLHSASQREFDALVERMKSGAAVGREEVRNKVSLAKTWNKQSAASAQALQNPSLPLDSVGAGATEPLGDEQDVSGQETGTEVDEADASEQEGGGKPQKQGSEAKKTPAKGDGKAKAKKLAQDHLDGFAPTAEQIKAAEMDQARQELATQRAELMDWGAVLRGHFAKMMVNMHTLGYDPTEGEWVLWTGFLDTVLPMLSAMDKPRVDAYLKKLGMELKKQEAIAIWRELHPVADGGAADSEEAERQQIADMPKGWTL